MAPGLVDESKGAQWPLPAGVVAGDKVRMTATVAGILGDARPSHQTKGDQLVYGALSVALITGIVAGHYRRVYDWLGRILRSDTPDVRCPHCGLVFLPPGAPAALGTTVGVSHPGGGEAAARRPLVKAPAR